MVCGSAHRVGFGPRGRFSTFPPEGKGGFFVWLRYSTQSDARGRFGFDRVIPGSGLVTHILAVELSGGVTRGTPCWPQSVHIKPGQTVQVTIGGKGRPVTGRIVIDGTPESPVDWTLNDPVEIGTEAAGLRRRLTRMVDFVLRTSPPVNGSWSFPVNAEPNARLRGAGTVIGKVNMPFTVPNMPTGRSNEPLDLGTITAKLFDALKVGDPAPDFDVERIGTPEKDRRLRLGDFRGKLILLNFWRAWEGQNDMIVLKEVQQAFGADPRFVLISLDCSQDASNATKFIKENGLSWIHGLAGEEGTGVSARYKVREFPNTYMMGRDDRRRRIPVTFLIGPDGRILAHDLIANDLEAVRKALEAQGLPRGTSSRPESIRKDDAVTPPIVLRFRENGRHATVVSRDRYSRNVERSAGCLDQVASNIEHACS